MKEGWEVKKLGEVSIFYNGYTPKETELFDSGIIPYFKVSDMNHPMNKKFLVHTDLFLNESNKIYPRNTIVFPKNGAAIATNKKRILERESVVDLNTGGIGVKDNCIYYLFLYYYLNNIDLKKYTRRGAVPTLDLKELKSLSIYLPPLPEQSRIVEELDLLSNIIEKKRQQLSELDNLAQSIFYNMFGDPVTNEKGWEVKKLGEVCKTSSGGTPSKSHSDYYEGGIIPWLRSGEVNQLYISKTELFITEEGLANSSAKWFPENTVVIAMYGATVGQVGILCKMMTTNQAICGIFPNESFIPIYLYHFLLSKKEEYIKLASGGAQPNISQNIIRDTLVCCPKKELQQLFAQKIEAIEKQKALIKQSIVEMEELFNSRMDYYFS